MKFMFCIILMFSKYEAQFFSNLKNIKTYFVGIKDWIRIKCSY